MRLNIRSFFGLIGLILITYTRASEARHYAVEGEAISRVWMSALQRATDESSSPREQPEVELKQKYRYTLTVCRLSDSLYEARWFNWRVEGAIAPELKPLMDAIRQLSPVYYRRRATGELEFFNLAGREAWQRQAVASILAPFQFVRPDTGQTEWRTVEAHPSGQVVCRYRIVRREKDGALVVNKAFAEVLISSEERAVGKSHQIGGHLQYRLSRQGVIVSIVGTLRERVELNGLPASQNETKLVVRLTQHRTVSEREIQQKRAQLGALQGGWLPLFAPPTEAEQEQARAQSLLQQTSPDTLIAELDAMLERLDRGEALPAAEQTQLRLKLDAGLVLYGVPFLNELTRRLQARSRPDDGFWLLAGVLSQSRLPRAQHALVETLQQSKDISLQRSLAQQLAFLSAPEKETLQKLWQLAREAASEELRQALTITVANLARRVRGQSPELYQSISAWARAQLEAASDAPAQRFWLTAIGALGDLDALPLIEQQARRGEELNRLSAIDALTNLPPEEALALLEKLYPLEPSALVREKMITLFNEEWWKQPAARALLERAAFNDTAIRVRKACVQTLRTLAARDQAALQLLVKIAKTHSEPSTRREAMIALAALHAAGVKVPNLNDAP